MMDIQLFTNSTKLTTLSKDQLEKINSRLPEFYRASAIIGHSTSQTSYSLQTMNMISDSPLARMKQCISQINKRKEAIQENYFKIEKKKLTLKRLEKNTDESSKLTVRKYKAEISTVAMYMENALRQLGMFQDMYETIRKNNKIDENWTEKDFEKQEIEHMIKSSFRLAIQDITATGRCSKAVVEYWEQIGILPQAGESLTMNYCVNTQNLVNEALKEGKVPDVKVMYVFLDKMVESFKDSYKLALARIGLDEIGSEGFMANGATKPQ